MAYADYDFYTGCYYGDTLTIHNAVKWLERASDKIDVITFGRLTFAFPTVEAHAVKVKKAVCAIADALCLVDIQRQASSAQQAEDGTYRGAVASVSSGKESISYSVNGSNASAYSAAAASESALNAMVTDIAVNFISGIPDANGVNLLYAGRR